MANSPQTLTEYKSLISSLCMSCCNLHEDDNSIHVECERYCLSLLLFNSDPLSPPGGGGFVEDSM